jgi:tetratricopeptide (TPR) repeat protein
MGAELGGLDVGYFDVEAVPPDGLRRMQSQAINWWKWNIRPNAEDAIGISHLAIYIYIPLRREDDVAFERETNIIEFKVEVVETQTEVEFAALTITNNLDQELCQVFFDPTSSDTWGENQLPPDTVINQGESHVWKLETATYDIRAIDCSGELLQIERNIELFEDTSLILSAPEPTLNSVESMQEALGLMQQGQVAFEEGQYVEALAYYGQVIDYAREFTDPNFHGLILISVGAVYEAQGQYDQALESYQQALAIQPSSDDTELVLLILGRIGEVYRAQGQYTEALRYLENALEGAQAEGNRLSESLTLISIGATYVDLVQDRSS